MLQQSKLYLILFHLLKLQILIFVSDCSECTTQLFWIIFSLHFYLNYLSLQLKHGCQIQWLSPFPQLFQQCSCQPMQPVINLTLVHITYCKNHHNEFCHHIIFLLDFNFHFSNRTFWFQVIQIHDICFFIYSRLVPFLMLHQIHRYVSMPPIISSFLLPFEMGTVSFSSILLFEGILDTSKHLLILCEIQSIHAIMLSTNYSTVYFMAPHLSHQSSSE